MNTKKGNCISCGVPKYLHGTCCGWANSNTIVKPLTDVERYYQSLQKKAGNYINVSNSPMTDKQPQTCYVECESNELDSVIYLLNGETIPIKKLDSVYIHTPEELEALKAKWMREAAEKAIDAFTDYPTFEKDVQQYLDQHYPLPNQ